MARAWMYDEPGRFIDDDDILVFEQDFERNRLRLIIDLFEQGLGQLDFIAGAHEITSPGCGVVERNKSGANQLLKP